MNAPLSSVTGAQKIGIVDCDIHPVQRSAADLYPYMSQRWREHSEMFGPHIRQGLTGMQVYPRMMAAGQRADAYPPGGGPPGSDLDMMRAQHLDGAGIEWGMLVALSKGGMEERNPDYATVLSHAVNDWQRHDWVAKEPRLLAGVVVPQEDAEFCVKEIHLRAQDKAFKQVIVSPRSAEPLGRRRYWPIYAAAQECGLPLGLHPAAFSGGAPSTSAGWPTYYMQEHYAFCTGMQGNIVSMIFEGVFEQFSKLKIALIESGFTWMPLSGCARRFPTSSGSPPNISASTSGSRPSPWRSPRTPPISPRSSNGSAGTACSSRRTIRTGTMTIRAIASASA